MAEIKETKSLTFSIDLDLNAIKLKIRNHKYVIIVEGHDDFVFYKQHLNVNENEFLFYESKFCDDSKGRACELARIDQNISNFCSIVDSDFDRILNEVPTEDNIILTDYHDLEMGIFHSYSVDKIVNFYSTPTLVNNLIGDSESLINFILKKSSIIGLVRLLNYINNWNIKFKTLHSKSKHVHPFFESGSFLDFDKSIQMFTSLIKSKIKEGESNYNIIKNEIESEIKNINKYELNQLCHGKDTIQICIYFLNHHLKGERSNILNYSDLFLSYETSYFYQSDLYKKFNSWLESCN